MCLPLDSMAEKPIASSADEIQPKQVAGDMEMAKDKGTLAPEDGGSSKKGRGLLKVPSRSSSHKNQSTAPTPLSGATAGESRNSIGGRSRNSGKGSFLGRQRNGSASTKRTGGDSDPTNTPGRSQPGSPMQRRKKKSGGLLSLLGCCGGSEPQDGPDVENQNAHKLETLPQTPATAKPRTPQEQPESKVLNEKDETIKQNEGDQGPSGDADQITVAVGEASGQSGAAAINVEPSKVEAQDGEITDRGDVAVQDASVEEPVGATTEEDKAIPPPPPGPTPTAPIAVAEAGPSGEEYRKALLPPIAPEHKGRKCLVLDLDETLVHSSFKVCPNALSPSCMALTRVLDSAPS